MDSFRFIYSPECLGIMSKRSPTSVADDGMTDTPREERLTLSRQLLRRLKVLMRNSSETNGGLTLGLSEVWIYHEMYCLTFLYFTNRIGQ